MERPNSLFSSSSSSPASTSSTSSSSSPSHHHHGHHNQYDLPNSYELFLSFRGEDTRHGFTSHLYAALCQKGIYTFLDDDKLERGKSISPELLKAIEGSTCSLIILSPNYASSTWCLDELVKIIHCKKTMGQIVLPIFYHVDPSHVRKQSGPFEQAFAKHEHDFRDALHKVQTWRAVFTEVANLGGWDLSNRNEAECIQEIVAHISNKVNAASTNHSNYDGLFGMDSRIEKLNLYVDIASSGVHVAGICGMGGLGKTTLARVYYNYMSYQFEGSSFLSNIREVCEKMTNGLESLQEQLLSETLKGNQQTKIWNSFDGTDMKRSRLRHKKVLIVIDDVNNLEQLEKLAGGLDWFGSGTRIIITTRDESLLTSHGVGMIYKIEQLNENEAHQHFAWNAFKSTAIVPPLQEYALLSEQAVTYCDGLPLALKLLGSFLCGKSVNEWKSALKRLQESPNKKIFATLRISFDGLEETEKEIFLDVACLFKGEDKDFVTRILNGCGFHPDIGIRNLLDKSLLTISEKNKLWMHDLLEEMGKEIVREESHNQPGRRSRLWCCEDVLHILKNDTASESVEAIVVEFPFKKETTIINFEAFSKMKKLRLLKLKCQYFFPSNENFYNPLRLCDINGYLSESLPSSLQPNEHFFNELRLLDVDGYPYESFPSSFQPDELIILNLFNGRMKQLWNTHIKPLYNLSVIDLSCCRYLIKIFQDFSVVPNLEKLILKFCEELTEIDSSISVLDKLTILDMEQCAKLRKLPSRIKGLKALKVLNLNSCSMLRKLPKDIWHLKKLEEMNLSGTGLKNLYSSIFSVNLIIPSPFQGASKALSIGLFSLKRLNLSRCGIRELPKELGCFVSLGSLNLSHNYFYSLPSTIRLLSRLKNVYFDSCVELRSLAQLPSSVGYISARNCSSLETFLGPVKQCNLLSTAFVEGCLELVRRQGSNRTALSCLKRFLENPHNRRCDFDILLPGSSISKWFSHQNSGSSISTELPPYWWESDNKLMGFALCVCVGPFYDGPLSIVLEINGQMEVGYGWIDISNSSDLLWIKYWALNDSLDKQSCDPISISFLVGDDHNGVFGHDSEVKSIGLRLVYEQTVEGFDQTIYDNCVSEWG